MGKKRYTNVVDVMRDLTEDRTFSDDLGKHLSRRRLVTELAALRAARGLSQKDVAERMGCTQGRISKVESSVDADLDISTLVAYADAIDLRVEITLAGKDATPVDRVKHHAFRIKRLTDHLAQLGSKDERIADGVANFLKEAAYNLVRLIRSSAKLLPSSPEESPPQIAIDVYGVDDEEEAEFCSEDRRAICAK